LLALRVFFAVFVTLARDFTVIIAMFMMALMFTSGIFWDINLIQDQSMKELLLTLNPLAALIDGYRQVLIYDNTLNIIYGGRFSLGLNEFICWCLLFKPIQQYINAKVVFMIDNIISVENVSLEYKSRAGFFKSFSHKALNNVTFDIKKGEVFGVLGGNGSGKSTLLQVLGGILQPDNGKVVVDKNITRSLLSLGLGFNPELTGEDNALISCMLNGYTKKDAKILLKQIGEFSELGVFFYQPVKTYSAGMKARLGFSTAVLAHVDILLIDEVLSVGDNAFKAKAQKNTFRQN
jgi:lipopolysaccharide transport system ATP-binding protein